MQWQIHVTEHTEGVNCNGKFVSAVYTEHTEGVNCNGKFISAVFTECTKGVNCNGKFVRLSAVVAERERISMVRSCLLFYMRAILHARGMYIHCNSGF